MDRIFEDANDLHVRATCIYGKTGESSPVAYTDSDCKVKMKTSELKNAFLKRAVIVIGDDLFIPIAFSVSGNIGSVTYAKNGSTAGSAATATLSAVKD